MFKRSSLSMHVLNYERLSVSGLSGEDRKGADFHKDAHRERSGKQGEQEQARTSGGATVTLEQPAKVFVTLHVAQLQHARLGRRRAVRDRVVQTLRSATVIKADERVPFAEGPDRGCWQDCGRGVRRTQAHKSIPSA